MSVLNDAGTTQGQTLLGDWQIFLYTALAIVVIVVLLILVPLFVWRRKKNNDFPPQFKKNTPLEITYTIIPLLIVGVLFYVTMVREKSVEAQTASPFAIVDVTGYRWSWRFQYPRDRVTVSGTPQAPPEFALPLGQTTRIVLDSVDVNHAFWIPAFLFKRDAIPGFTNSFDLTPTRQGVFHGVCAEFCGLDHTGMTFSVRVLPPAAYRRWLESHRNAKS
ncbi:MAG: cytochrome c oxidase subunit II [Candidatus Eremiobacteraeota bacterium]|nr:cytochrome c oxidase subunit II [Candidatus Eremiobacteraeota bacterium]